MIVDTSAIMAIALDEPESEPFLLRIAQAPLRRISVGTGIELGVVVERRHTTKANLVESFRRGGNFIIEPGSIKQAEIAQGAYRKYGQASGHPARRDFVHTDVTPAA